MEMLTGWWKLFQAKEWGKVFPAFLGEGEALGKQTQGAKVVFPDLPFQFLSGWTSEYLLSLLGMNIERNRKGSPRTSG